VTLLSELHLAPLKVTAQLQSMVVPLCEAE